MRPRSTPGSARGSPKLMFQAFPNPAKARQNMRPFRHFLLRLAALAVVAAGTVSLLPGDPGWG
ncbi:hypothetical protein GCM10020229_79350 [Kitasatospora albolonga]